MNARDTIERYLERHARDIPEADRLPDPAPELRASVVIPVYDELDNIGAVLESLALASETPELFEVIVVVNNATDASAEIVERNRQTLALMDGLELPYVLHTIDRTGPDTAYEPEVAGVGLARREGADLALGRLLFAGRAADGLMPCLDGDSPVAPGYIDGLLRTFDARPELLAGVCPYRHPLPDQPEHVRAIAAYEGWMRYWEAALRLTGTPYAFQSIGSCMVLTARGYALADGMPTLQALSDFYILEKVVKAGGRGSVDQLDVPMVFPSARPSERVPRGTGPSVRMQLETKTSRFEMAEPPAAFFALGRLFSAVRPGFLEPSSLRDAVDDPLLAEYLADNNAWHTFEKFRDNAPTPAHFERHFHTWFDNLKIVKFANEAKRQRGGVWLFDAAREVYATLGETEAAEAIPFVGHGEAGVEAWRVLLEVLRD